MQVLHTGMILGGKSEFPSSSKLMTEFHLGHQMAYLS
jgi:hypothetical protein